MHTQGDLQSALETFMGNRNVYFQPPSNVHMTYPCIIYDWATPDIEYANNFIYMHTKSYLVTIVDQNKISEIPDKFLRAFQYVKPGRIYKADGLWHFTFNLFY